MDSDLLVLLAACVALAAAAGCTAGLPVANATPGPVLPSPSLSAGVLATPAPVPVPLSLKIGVAPLRYSPAMSSTPGIGLTPDLSGPGASGASIEWNASFGRFLTWSPPDYPVREQGPSVTNHGEKVYWTFSDLPPSAGVPVVITAVARDARTGGVLGSSTVTLGWEGNTTVVVRSIL